ncbi:MAG TPA: SurA N-terminal domain-containing protein, partial [Fibrobacteraceae bacterium]|nr:SurA N-terminal domain-containing protein [Fibrobacteraceae bacterium]
MKTALISFFLLTSLLSAAPELAESIVAVVNGKVILRSELLAALQQSQSNPSFLKLAPKEQQLQVLNAMIDEKVILARAEQDSILISDAEVRSRVDAHLQMLASRQHMDMKALEKAIRTQAGLTMSQYRDQLSSQIHDQMLMARVRQKHIGEISPTRAEVEAFYQQYRDSLPMQYNSIRVSHLQLKIAPDAQILDSVRTLAANLIDSLDQGIAWDILAARHSQDSMAAKGGDLGYFRKGLLEPEYERAAWKLDL